MIRERQFWEGRNTVYQSIDDPQDELAPRDARRSRWAWVLAAFALLAIFAAVYLSRPGTAVPHIDDDAARAELITYRKAMSETPAPLRRARLQDFLTTYPESQRVLAVEAQLDVINAHEASRWIEVSDIIYDPRSDKETKLAALDAFETRWGASLLGGRSNEIGRMRDEISQSADIPETPIRKLKEGPSPIPKNIPDGSLAGGPRPVAPPVIIRPASKEEPVKVVELDVIEPTVRRNVTPRYPRKAMRRKVEAVVTLKLNINPNGKVAMTELVSVEAERYSKDFVKAAERAAMRTRFHPKTVGGRPQSASGVTKRYRFQLD